MKPIRWISASLKDLREFPKEVQSDVGFALFRAQEGKKSEDAKPLKGFGGANILEVVSSYDGDAYRAVYTVRFAEAIYVLHCFQKKSKSGISTPQHEIDLIKRRLKTAEEDYKAWQASKEQ